MRVEGVGVALNSPKETNRVKAKRRSCETSAVITKRWLFGDQSQSAGSRVVNTETRFLSLDIMCQTVIGILCRHSGFLEEAVPCGLRSEMGNFPKSGNCIISELPETCRSGNRSNQIEIKREMG